MISKEHTKVILASSLLFFLCFISYYHSSINGTTLEWTYPFYDYKCDCFTRTPVYMWSETYDWFFKTTFDKVAPIIISLIFIINPDFKKWGVNLMWLWTFYFFLLMVNYTLTYDSMNIIATLNKILIVTQLYYCFDYSSKQVEG